MFQREVSSLLGINDWTLCNWENDKTEPEVRMFPKIIKFLGYDPYPAPQTIAETLVAHRRQCGLSRAGQAEMIGIDEGTLLRLERSQGCSGSQCEGRIREFLAKVL